MKPRFPILYFSMLLLLIGLSTFCLARWQAASAADWRAQHTCTCVLGQHYDENAPDFTMPEDCLVHGRDAQ